MTEIVRLTGEIDRSNADQLLQALRSSEARVLECSELEFIDASGIAILAEIHNERGLTLVNPSYILTRVLDLCKIPIPVAVVPDRFELPHSGFQPDTLPD